MSSTALVDPDIPSTSLREKLLNLLVSPGEVFEEIVAARPSFVNWLVPTLLVCLSGLGLLWVSTPDHSPAAAAQPGLEATTVSAANVGPSPADWSFSSALTTCLVVIGGTLWAAFVLWFIGRALLNTRFSFLKTVEVVALAGMILAFGTVVTALLILASGDVAARPALSFFATQSESGNTLRAILETLNVFHFWTTTVLAIGLSKLSGVSFKEAAFWVFGYWVAARMALILLS